MTNTKYLEGIEITKIFGGIVAVHNLSFELERGKITSLIGPNGAGKSTLFNLMTGFLPLDQGSIFFQDSRIDRLTSYKIARRGIARTFQELKLFPELTCLENLMVARTHRLGEDLWTPFFCWRSVKKEERRHREKVEELLRYVSLEDKINEQASNLSYGQQKLLSVARVLASEPELLLLDEPVAGVNPQLIGKIIELLLKIKSLGKTIFFIEHNIEVVMDISDKVIVLNYGEKVTEDKPQEVRQNPKVIEAYLGRRKRKIA